MHLDPPFDPCEEPGREHKRGRGGTQDLRLRRRAPGADLALALLAAMALLFTAPAKAQVQTTLVSNASENRDNFVVAGDSASGRITQRFTTGSNTAGYGLSSVGIHIHGDTSSSTETITVSVHRFDSSKTNNLGDLVATLGIYKENLTNAP